MRNRWVDGVRIKNRKERAKGSALFPYTDGDDIQLGTSAGSCVQQKKKFI
jgi:hypothetical protein